MDLFKRNAKSVTLHCFSPGVMLTTFIIEMLIAIYILLTAKLRPAATLLILILIFLSIFQLAEYQICAVDNSIAWMRLGYVAITMLPPLGLHLISLVTKRTWLIYAGYAIALVFIVSFIFITSSIHMAQCGGNYLIVNTGNTIASVYFPLYYYLLILVALLEIAHYDMDNNKEKEIKNNETLFLRWLFGGYAAFLIPTGAVYLMAPTARNGIPSIMCGFAVLLAIIIWLKVYPLSKKLKI